jgi:hypothetical protein
MTNNLSSVKGGKTLRQNKIKYYIAAFVKTTRSAFPVILRVLA